MHVDRYVNVYRLREFKILRCGLEKINQSKNDACGSLEEYPHFSLSLYHKRQVNVHCSLAFTRNVQLLCDCLQGAVRSHRGKHRHKDNEEDKDFLERYNTLYFYVWKTKGKKIQIKSNQHPSCKGSFFLLCFAEKASWQLKTHQQPLAPTCWVTKHWTVMQYLSCKDTALNQCDEKHKGFSEKMEIIFFLSLHFTKMV